MQIPLKLDEARRVSVQEALLNLLEISGFSGIKEASLFDYFPRGIRHILLLEIESMKRLGYLLTMHDNPETRYFLSVKYHLDKERALV